MSDPRDDDGDIEWRRPWGLYAIVALLAVVVVTGGIVKLAGRGGDSASPPPSPTPSSSAAGTPSHRVPPGTVKALPSAVRQTFRHVHTFAGDIPGTWRFVGLSHSSAMRSGRLVVVHPGTGTAVTKKVPPLMSSGPVSLVAGDDTVLIHPTDVEPSYVYDRAGMANRYDGGLLGSGGTVLPGPQPGQVWVQDSADGDLFRLLRFDGRRTGVAVRRPNMSSWFLARPDGAGYLLFETGSGAYDVRPGGQRRITKGSVVAAGPTTWLIRDCQGSRSCRLSVVDRSTGKRHTVPPPCPVRPGPAPSGVISPDGHTAALVCGSTHGASVLYLLDLRTGDGGAVTVDLLQEQTSMVWAPGSRWLFTLTSRGKVEAVRRNDRTTRSVAPDLPPLSQLSAASPTETTPSDP